MDSVSENVEPQDTSLYRKARRARGPQPAPWVLASRSREQEGGRERECTQDEPSQEVSSGGAPNSQSNW